MRKWCVGKSRSSLLTWNVSFSSLIFLGLVCLTLRSLLPHCKVHRSCGCRVKEIRTKKKVNHNLQCLVWRVAVFVMTNCLQTASVKRLFFMKPCGLVRCSSSPDLMQSFFFSLLWTNLSVGETDSQFFKMFSSVMGSNNCFLLLSFLVGIVQTRCAKILQSSKRYSFSTAFIV